MKITIDRSLVEQALEALESYATHRPLPGRCPVRDVEYALRAALAEPDIDPVDEYRKGFIDGQIDMRDRPEEQQEPVQEPVAGRLLTDDEIQTEWSQTPQNDYAEGLWFGRRIENLVRSIALAEPQEPSSIRELLTQAAAMAVAAERAGRYEGASWVADAVLETDPPQRPAEPVSVTDLQQALIETNLIDPDAIDDPEGYDAGFTVAQIDALHGLLFKSQRQAETDTDCHAQGICQRSGYSVGQRKPLTETSAERTLKRMGYTDCGGQFWKPPLGAPAQPQEPVPDRLEQLRAFCTWERVNSPHPEGLPHVAEWAVMEIDRLRAAKAQPVQARVKRSQDWHDGVIEGHLRERDYWLAQQAQPVQEQCKGDPGECEFNGGCMYACAKPEPDTDCHAQGICQRSGYNIGQSKPLSYADALRIATEAIGRLKSTGPVEGLVGLVRAVEAAHGIGKQE